MVLSYCVVCKKNTESKDVDLGEVTANYGGPQKTLSSVSVEGGKKKSTFTT
jgi:hypothetical protein